MSVDYANLIVEDDDNDKNEEELNTAEPETDEGAVKEDEEKAGNEPTIEVPEKFKNKSLEDIVKSYMELEKEFGRRNQELGELRKLTDEFLKSQIGVKASATEQEPQKPDVSVDELFDDPADAIVKAVEHAPTVRKLQEELMATKAEIERTKLLEKHPDAIELAQTQEFQSWVMESPIRQELFQRAHMQYDFKAADELITWYKTFNQSKKEAAKEIREDIAEKTAKEVRTERNASQPVNKKIFRRAELIRLRLEDPARYAALEDEIIKAYAEGRVK